MEGLYYLYGILENVGADAVRGEEVTINTKPRYPAPVIAVTKPAAPAPPQEEQEVPEPTTPSEESAPRSRRAPKPSSLPDDLLHRTDEEAARRLALKMLAAARSAERRLDDPTDREALHDFRVAIRRLRSLLRAWKVQLGGAVRAKDRDRLRRIQRATGGGREAEVALEWLTKQHRDLPPAAMPGLNWLSGTLLERRRQCAEDLDDRVRTSFRRTADKLENNLAVMRREHNLLDEHTFTSFARSAANLAEAHATDLLVGLGQIASMEDHEKLHDARIMGKRLRYLLEPLRAYVPEAQAVVKQSKRLQDLLGDLNDVHVLMRELDQAFVDAMTERGERAREALRTGNLERARREASVTEWQGFLELYERLQQERRNLIGELRDRWLNGDLDKLVSRTRNLAQSLRAMEQEGQ